MKTTIIFATVLGLMTATTAQAELYGCNRPDASHRPSYCEPAKPPQAAPKKQYRAPAPQPRAYPPRKRYEDHPLYIVPSFLGMLLAGASDAVEDTVTGVYKGVKNTTAATGALLSDSVDRVLPNR